MEKSPESAIRPMVQPGEEVTEGDVALQYDLPLFGDERTFQERMEAIDKAERRAWVEGQTIFIR